MHVESLFPLPIGFFDLEKIPTESETAFVLAQKKRKNEGNTTSVDNYILNQSALREIKGFISDSLNKYFVSIYSPKNDVKLRITQSWLNYTKKDQWHHKHKHPNSLVSGVFYFSANKDTDKIYFYRDPRTMLDIPPAGWNMFNSTSWWFPVFTGRLILFPSHLTHMVETVQSKDTRISLAFNTFPVGVLGEENMLTSLKLTD